MNETQRVRRGHDFYPSKSIRDVTPKLYDTEKQGADRKTVFVHYFVASADWYVVEADWSTGECFGWAELFPGGGELGYFDLNEMERLTVGTFVVERDLYWEPRSLKTVLVAR